MESSIARVLYPRFSKLYHRRTLQYFCSWYNAKICTVSGLLAADVEGFDRSRLALDDDRVHSAYKIQPSHRKEVQLIVRVWWWSVSIARAHWQVSQYWQNVCHCDHCGLCLHHNSHLLNQSRWISRTICRRRPPKISDYCIRAILSPLHWPLYLCLATKSLYESKK